MSKRAIWAAVLAFGVFLAAAGAGPAWAEDAKPVLWWSFDEKTEGKVKDLAGGKVDVIKGKHTFAAGVSGAAIKPDGFTTSIDRNGRAPELGGALTAGAWVAPAAYPWNWCPVVAMHNEEGWGFRLAAGPHGDFALELSIEGRWRRCVSDKFVLPLRRWTHIAGSYDPNDGITLYVNGKAAGKLAVTGKPDWQERVRVRGLMNYEKVKPSNIYRSYGVLPGWFSIDGLVDEVKVYDAALSARQVRADATPADEGVLHTAVLPRRRMPIGPRGPGRFGAYYCQLKYYPEWDALWSVDEHADVVVRFDQSATRVVFWRGSRYSAAWVSETGLWMADQSVEGWNQTQGCYEHMQDPRCRYSHVRIIESSDARAVVHWRYALVSAHNELWGEDPKTGRAAWIDEYYTIYPDQLGIRKPTWKTGTIPRPTQYQESLPFTEPEQTVGEVVEKTFATIANFDGQTAQMSYVPGQPDRNRPVPKNLTVQRYNFRSKNRPSIIFEPGNRMHRACDQKMRPGGMKSPGSCNHWPVGQQACDGRRVQAADRPTHFLGFPISYPPLHEKDGRTWWNGLYGMTEMSMAELVFAGRSWAYAPKLTLRSRGFVGGQYDRAERAYQIAAKRPTSEGELALTLAASENSPVFNPAFVITGWSPDPKALGLTLNAKPVPRGDAFRVGTRRTIDGADTIVFIRAKSTRPVTIELKAKPADKP